MLEPAFPFDEATRIATLRGLNILDTPPEERFDRLTRIIRNLINVPIALISLVDSNRQWFKSCYGLDATETSRGISFCGHAILDDQVFLIPDASADMRFADNPLVTGAPHIRFYAGQPLKVINGSRIGTLCVIDTVPRDLSEVDLQNLKDLGSLVEKELNSLELEEAILAMHNSQKRLGAIVDNVLDGIITINESGIVESFNKAAESIFQYSATEVIGKNVKLLMPDPFHSEHDGYLNNFISTGNKKIIGIGRQVVGKRKDSSTFPMDLAVSEMKLGDIRLFTGLVRDITERVKVEEIQAQYSAIIESSTDAIISENLNGIITSWNPAAEKTFGYKEEEIIGKPMLILIPEDRQNEEVEILRKIRRGEQISHFETTRKKKNGELFPISVTISPIKNELGAIIGASKIVRDISERVEVERMKSEFISTVSHELRTPLTSIRGSLALVVGGVLGEMPVKIKPLVDIAHKNCERLILLVNDILDMEKIEAGKMDFQIQPVRLFPLLEQALEGNRSYGDQFKVSYSFENTIPDVIIRVDQNRLMQVFANLLSNAAKFSPTGGNVLVSAELINKRIRISVKDNGIGITPEFKHHIFQKFAQADSSDTKKKGGTGLGLSITKAIIEQMNGVIGFQSIPNVQTTFFIDFPVWEELTVAPILSKDHSNKKRILICEDDPDIATLLRLMLEQAGMVADIANNPIQAKELLAVQSYAAMTLDLSMPKQDGISFIRELRSEKNGASLPIIVVSAKANEGQKELNSEAFCIIDWIVKPIDQEQLVKALKQAVVSVVNSQVLHVEDDPDIVAVVKTIIGDVAEVYNATNLADARAMLQSKSYDLVILDVSLPDGIGLELLPELNGAKPPIPVMVFSATEVRQDDIMRVNSALVKSRTDNNQLLETIKRLIGSE